MASPLSTKKRSLHQMTAVEEATRGYKLTTQLRSLLKLQPQGSRGSELAGTLLDEVLQALSASISILNRGQAKCHGSPDLASASVNQWTNCYINKEKPKQMNGPHGQVTNKHQSRWMRETSAPYVDGHQWRKYGEKKIQNSNYPRCYYRCTYKEDRQCPATKQVQQKDSEDPPIFNVTYNMQHTCRNELVPLNLVENSLPLEVGLLSFRPKTAEIKQEHVLHSPEIKQEHAFSSPSSIKSITCGELVNHQKDSCSTSDQPILYLPRIASMKTEDPIFTAETHNWESYIPCLSPDLQRWEMDSLIAGSLGFGFNDADIL